MGKGNFGGKRKSDIARRNRIKTNVIESLRNNKTYIVRYTDSNIGESQYNYLICDYREILPDVRTRIGNANVMVHEHIRDETRRCQGDIIGITIYYYTDKSHPQPQPQPQPLPRRELHQHTDVPCCALL